MAVTCVRDSTAIGVWDGSRRSRLDVAELAKFPWNGRFTRKSDEGQMASK